MAKVIWVVCCTWSMLHSNLSYTTAQCSNILVKITQIVHSPNPTFIPQTLLAVSVYIQLGFWSVHFSKVLWYFILQHWLAE